jgi:hypothetical protein
VQEFSLIQNHDHEGLSAFGGTAQAAMFVPLTQGTAEAMTDLFELRVPIGGVDREARYLVSDSPRSDGERCRVRLRRECGDFSAN